MKKTTEIVPKFVETRPSHMNAAAEEATLSAQMATVVMVRSVKHTLYIIYPFRSVKHTLFFSVWLTSSLRY